jgi:4-diphosphocytidyl-2-C-methyl-D-erythritol kinase
VPDTGWRLAAPAKLNLWLHVVGRRADGFHELDSLVVLLDLADEVRTRPGKVGFEVLGEHVDGVPTDEANLAWRGWVAGWGTGSPSGEVAVHKVVPVAAGLGGGSSDAAAGWRLARVAAGLGDEPAAEATLADLAAIGADVPYFAAQQPAARVTGIGEHVAPAPTPTAREVVLVHPPFRLSTAAVFGRLTPADWSIGDGDPLVGRNDLLAAARRIRPELDEVVRLTTRAGGEPRLTGSGPTIFVLTDDPERADGVASRLDGSGLVTTRTRLRTEPASIEAG